MRHTFTERFIACLAMLVSGLKRVFILSFSLAAAAAVLLLFFLSQLQ